LKRRVPFRFSVSATTRPARPGEVDGEDYHFIERSRFEDLVARGAFLEWAEYSGNLYGTLRSEIDEPLAAGEVVVLDIEIQGVLQVKQTLPEAVFVYIAPPDEAELERRLRGRGDTSDVERRLAIARAEADAAAGVYDHRVVNDDVDRAVSHLVGILRGAAGPADDDEENPAP
jgi:guanylate kinase